MEGGAFSNNAFDRYTSPMFVDRRKYLRKAEARAVWFTRIKRRPNHDEFVLRDSFPRVAHLNMVPAAAMVVLNRDFPGALNGLDGIFDEVEKGLQK